MTAEITRIRPAVPTPWDTIGRRIDLAKTSREAMEMAKVDWTVSCRPVYFGGKEGGGEMTKDYQAIVRDDNDALLSIMGDGYRPIQNVDKFGFFDEVVGEGKAQYDTVLALDGGRRIAILAKLPGIIQVPGTDDVTNKYLLLADSFDGSLALTVGWTAIRVYCANTLNLALRGMQKTAAFKIRHSVNLRGRVQQAQQVLGFADKTSKTFEAQVHYLAAQKFTDDQMKLLATNLFPDGKEGATTRTLDARNKVVDLFENGRGHEAIRGSGWAAVQAAAEYADHHRVVRKTDGKAEAEARTLSVLFGSAATFKQQAVDQVYKLLAA